MRSAAIKSRQLFSHPAGHWPYDPERQKAVQATWAEELRQIIRRAREVIKELEATTRETDGKEEDLTLADTARTGMGEGPFESSSRWRRTADTGGL